MSKRNISIYATVMFIAMSLAFIFGEGHAVEQVVSANSLSAGLNN